jgi:hypothetical protein
VAHPQAPRNHDARGKKQNGEHDKRDGRRPANDAEVEAQLQTLVLNA